LVTASVGNVLRVTHEREAAETLDVGGAGVSEVDFTGSGVEGVNISGCDVAQPTDEAE
jgi:hypothetical protein